MTRDGTQTRVRAELGNIDFHFTCTTSFIYPFSMVYMAKTLPGNKLSNKVKFVHLSG